MGAVFNSLSREAALLSAHLAKETLQQSPLLSLHGLGIPDVAVTVTWAVPISSKWLVGRHQGADVKGLCRAQGSLTSAALLLCWQGSCELGIIQTERGLRDCRLDQPGLC